MKNIVVCCDGTANEFAEDKTNVIKLYSTLVHDPMRQVAYYHPGLGTMEHPGAVTDVGRKVTRLLGKAIGYGLENDVRDAYTFLMRNYEPGDRLYLFGFSRGAYTVRAVAALLHMYGLIRQGHEPLVPYAIRMLMGINAEKDAKRQAAFRLADEFRATFCSVRCKPWFVGVWDTVSSVGWIQNPLRLPYIANNPDIQIARHAISIDERRAFFRTNLWRRSEETPVGTTDMKQVWFPGVHCDVGGGYPESRGALSRIALGWMLAEARSAFLLVDDERAAGASGEITRSEQNDKLINKSLTWHWYLAEFIPKRHFDSKTRTEGWRVNLFRPRKIPAGSLVHESAFQTSEEYRRKLPANAIVEKTAIRIPSSTAE